MSPSVSCCSARSHCLAAAARSVELGLVCSCCCCSHGACEAARCQACVTRGYSVFKSTRTQSARGRQVHEDVKCTRGGAKYTRARRARIEWLSCSTLLVMEDTSLTEHPAASCSRESCAQARRSGAERSAARWRVTTLSAWPGARERAAQAPLYTVLRRGVRTGRFFFPVFPTP